VKDRMPVVVPVRMHGGKLTPQPLLSHERARYRPILLKRLCPSCGDPLVDEGGEFELLVVVPLGPGRNEVMRAAQRQGKWFDSVGIVCHRRCLGVEPVLGVSGKVAAAATLLRTAADELAERTEGFPDDVNPTADIRNMAGHIQRMSHDLSGYEERVL
jgi:hypothetical protein